MTDVSQVYAVTKGDEGRPAIGQDAAGLAQNLLSQGSQFGDLVFEGIRFWEKRIAFLKEHIGRMQQAANQLNLVIPDAQELHKIVASTVHASGLRDGYIRLLAVRPWTGWGIASTNSEAQIVCGVGELDLHRQARKRSGLRLCTATVRKAPRSVLDGSLKWGGNYVNSKRASLEAVQRKCDDALMLTVDKEVSEATVANIFWVKGKRLYTPEVSEQTNCLDGITRRKIILIASDLGFDVTESLFYAGDLSGVDEMFLTGTGAGIVGVRQLAARGESRPALGSGLWAT